MTGPQGAARDVLVERIARAMHDTYERLAPDHGWQTQDATRAKPWEEVPEHNRTLMLATVAGLLDAGVIEVGPAILPGFQPAGTVGQRWGALRADR